MRRKTIHAQYMIMSLVIFQLKQHVNIMVVMVGNKLKKGKKHRVRKSNMNEGTKKNSNCNRSLTIIYYTDVRSHDTF